MRSVVASRTGKSAGLGPYRRAGRLKFELLEPRMLLTGSIQGLKWLDLDVDGRHDFDEPGIPEWTIYLQGIRNGAEDGERWITETDPSGEYLFPNLPDGTYTVSEELPDGWTQTFPGPQAELKDIETYPVGEGEATDFRFISASVMDYADTDPIRNANRLPVDVTVEVVWPDWSWSVQPERTSVSIEGNRIDVGVFGQNTDVYPEIPGPKVESHTFSLPPLEPGRYSMAATLYEDNIYMLRPAPAPSLGTSAAMLLGAVGTHIVEVPGDPTFAPRHFDFGNIGPHEQPGPHIISHDPSGEIPYPVHEVLVTFNEPIDPGTFTPEDVYVAIGLLELYVPVFDVRAVDDVTFLIEFGGPDMALDYHVWVGPHVENLAGIEMDQDRDGRPGEPDDDVYDAGFVVVEPIAPRVVDQWPAPDTTEWLVSSVRVTFNEPMAPATVNEDTFWVTGNVDDGVLQADVPVEMRVPGEVSYDETTHTAIFTPHLERLPQGTYALVAEDAITDWHGVALDGEWSGRFPSGDGQPGGHYLTLFEVSQQSMIQGAKWDDGNGNGLWDPDELGLEDWRIYVDQNGNRQWDNGEPFDVTGRDGAYAIEVAPGEHTVAEQWEPGWQQTFPWIHGGPQFQVNSTFMGPESQPAVAADAEGNFVVVGFGGSYAFVPVVSARMYRADGTPTGDEFQVNTLTIPQGNKLTVARDAVGNFVIAWTGREANNEGSDIYARTYDAGGNPLGPEQRVNTTTAGRQSMPSAAMAPGGELVIAWAGPSSNAEVNDQQFDVFARVFRPDAASLSDEFQVNTITNTGRWSGPSAAMDRSGNVAIAWAGTAAEQRDFSRIYTRLFDRAGRPMDAEFRVDTTDWDVDSAPSVAMDASGNFTVVWNSDDMTDGPGYADVHGRVFYAGGAAHGEEFQVNSDRLAASYHSSLAMGATGDFVVAWTGEMWNENRDDVYSRMFLADGTPIGQELVASVTPSNAVDTEGPQWAPAVAMDDDDRFVVAWAGTSDANALGVFARQFRGFGSAAVHQVLVHPGQAVERVNFGNKIDRSGPRIVWHTPSGTIPLPANQVDVRFNEAIDETTFTTDDVTVTADNLRLYIPVTGIRPLGNNSYRITFDGPGLAIDYHVVIGPHVEDTAGNEMDQNQDGAGGGPNDVYDAWFIVAHAAGSIQGSKFNDLNGNGTWDNAESGLPGWTIYLDLDNDSRLDPGEPWTLTGGRGDYEFANLNAGTYVVAEVLQEGWQQMFPPPRAELIDAGSRQIGDGAALGFGISDVQVPPHTAEYPWPVDSAAIDVTLEVVWPSTRYGLQHDATTFSIEGDNIVIDLYGGMINENAFPVVWTEYQTVTIPFPQSGVYTIHATLHEAPSPILPAFVPTWVGIGEMVAQWGGRHVVRLASGEIARDVDFGNTRQPQVLGRHVFYNNSAFDANDPEADAGDDQAIAPDKQALLPGQTATFANYTSYSRGINGIMVDVSHPTSTITAEDFEFKVGNNDDPAGWDAVTAPTSVTVRPGEGVEDSDRVTIIWADYDPLDLMHAAVAKKWLQVTVLATPNTRLAEPDVFYFGNAIGEIGNSTTEAKVNAIDMLAARNNPHNFFNQAPLDDFVDFNRDQRVNATDMLIARNNTTNFFTALKLITVPAGKAGESEKSRRMASVGQDSAALAAGLEADRDTAKLDNLLACDAVLERTAGRDSGRREGSVGKLTWLYEFEPASAKRQDAVRDVPTPAALDRLLTAE